MMQIYLLDWLNLALKLLHVIAGIAWIGASFYFNWLENKLDRLNMETADPSSLMTLDALHNTFSMPIRQFGFMFSPASWLKRSVRI